MPAPAAIIRITEGRDRVSARLTATRTARPRAAVVPRVFRLRIPSTSLHRSTLSIAYDINTRKVGKHALALE
ncbi:hypothetical protein GCM10009530_24590 [Microbispora corallina]|uniref:Uncharacterized protein n=1 Tax=Microbispora corallina TaxID=83302 RepID=A0ABQ4G494_9ACTN|nr:hypothetical protein Mco01_48710 [Microbispora corallina]